MRFGHIQQLLHQRASLVVYGNELFSAVGDFQQRQACACEIQYGVGRVLDRVLTQNRGSCIKIVLLHKIEKIILSNVLRVKTAGKCRRKNHVPKEKCKDCEGITRCGFKTAKLGHQKPLCGTPPTRGGRAEATVGKLRRSLSIATGVTCDERHRLTILHLLPRNISHPG